MTERHECAIVSACERPSRNGGVVGVTPISIRLGTSRTSLPSLSMVCSGDDLLTLAATVNRARFAAPPVDVLTEGTYNALMSLRRQASSGEVASFMDADGSSSSESTGNQRNLHGASFESAPP